MWYKIKEMLYNYEDCILTVPKHINSKYEGED